MVKSDKFVLFSLGMQLTRSKLIYISIGLFSLISFSFLIYNIYQIENYSKIKHEKTFKSPISQAALSPLEVISTHVATKPNGTTIFKDLLGRILGSENRTTTYKPLKYEVFGFLPYWTLDKRIHFRYEILSTIAYFGVDTDSKGNFVRIHDDGRTDGGWDTWNSSELAEVIMESQKHGVKFLLTVKGFDNDIIEKLLGCPKCRANLIKNTLEEVKAKKIDGVNLDFEYVGVPEEATIFQFTQLTKDFSDIFHKEIPGSYITVSSYAKSASETKIHDIKNLARVSDGIFIMAYDFFRPTSNYAGPVAPLGGAEKYGYDIKTTVSDYLKLASPDKIILGLPYYGYDWPVESNDPNAKRIPGTDETGYANMSSYVKSQYDPLNTVKSRKWDNDAQVPFYSWYDEEHKVWRQCYYDDVKSLGLKYDLIKEKNLKGVGIWALGYDGPYPELWDLLEEKFTK